MSGADQAVRQTFLADPMACAVLVVARSTVGTVSFGTTCVTGELEAVLDEQGRVVTAASPRARVTMPLDSLTSGNALYDAELQKRLDTRRHPHVTVELLEATAAFGSSYQVRGQVTLHGVTAILHGSVSVTSPEPGTVLIAGEQLIDIRDFDIDLPSVLMLRIYPDVTVRLQLLARQVAA